VLVQTWADWRDIPIFYFLYDWLLVMLEEAVSPFERPHTVTISTAWQQMACVALLGGALFLTTMLRLGWLVLSHFCAAGTLHLLQSSSREFLICCVSSATVLANDHCFWFCRTPAQLVSC